MASYIGKVQIGETTPVLVGSTLYGVCNTVAATALKDITEDTISSQNKITGDYVNTRYDTAITGTTIHIKFVYGNTATSNIQLKVGTLTTPLSVVGNFTCPANTIISFTLDENNNWVVNDNVDTNTEYVFKTAYNASTNKALTESDIAAAATKGVITDIANNTSKFYYIPMICIPFFTLLSFLFIYIYDPSFENENENIPLNDGSINALTNPIISSESNTPTNNEKDENDEEKKKKKMKNIKKILKKQ